MTRTWEARTRRYCEVIVSVASVSMKEMASVAVARGRLGSAVSMQLIPRMEAAMMRRREAL